MQLIQALKTRIVSVMMVLAVSTSGTAVVMLAQAQTELSGVYTIQQASTQQFLDAYEKDAQDWAVVTRPTAQNNPTQRWIFSRVSGQLSTVKPVASARVYTIQQQSNGRYLDAHLTEKNDFAVVTRKAQNNETQRWIVTAMDAGTYSIQQESTARYMDAYQDKARDFAVVVRSIPQPNLTQRWIITAVK